MGNWKRAGGFSLLEVLVALVILGMTLVGVFGLFSGGLQTARVVKDYTQAVIYARQKLEELILSPSLSPKFSSGIFEGSDYRWEVRIAPYTGRGWPKRDPDLPQLLRVQVKVTWPGPKRERSYELVTLKMLPREEEPSATPAGPDQRGQGVGARPPGGAARGPGGGSGSGQRGGSSGLGLELGREMKKR